MDDTDDKMMRRVLEITVDIVDIYRAVTNNANEEKKMFSLEKK